MKPMKLPSKRWHELILRVWHADTLRRPVCQNPMRFIAVIDDPRVVERILRHLGARQDLPAGLSPPGAAEPYTCEPGNATAFPGLRERANRLRTAPFQDPFMMGSGCRGAARGHSWSFTAYGANTPLTNQCT
jgi:hypothetical protein